MVYNVVLTEAGRKVLENEDGMTSVSLPLVCVGPAGELCFGMEPHLYHFVIAAGMWACYTVE